MHVIVQNRHPFHQKVMVIYCVYPTLLAMEDRVKEYALQTLSLIHIFTGDYTSKQISTLQNAVYIRLTTPLGTWWADGRVGSLLHTIPKEKDLRHVGPLAQQYAEEALQPLIDDGRAAEIIVTYTQPHKGLLILDRCV